MVDITQKPYFHYNDDVNLLSEQIRQHADVHVLGFARFFPNHQRFMICNNKEWWIDYYINELYRYSPYENKHKILKSSYNMWDHLPYAPPEIYQHSRKKFNIAHGLSVIQQYGDYCDCFVFATQSGNNKINNFYLNHKELFKEFIDKFYIQMDYAFSELSKKTFKIPENTQYVASPHLTLTSRQQDCAELLINGASTKEIAKVLQLSPRTVESHIEILKEKFSAKNRSQLVHSLNKIL